MANRTFLAPFLAPMLATVLALLCLACPARAESGAETPLLPIEMELTGLR